MASTTLILKRLRGGGKIWDDIDLKCPFFFFFFSFPCATFVLGCCHICPMRSGERQVRTQAQPAEPVNSSAVMPARLTLLHLSDRELMIHLHLACGHEEAETCVCAHPSFCLSSFFFLRLTSMFAWLRQRPHITLGFRLIWASEMFLKVPSSFES